MYCYLSDRAHELMLSSQNKLKPKFTQINRSSSINSPQNLSFLNKTRHKNVNHAKTVPRQQYENHISSIQTHRNRFIPEPQRANDCYLIRWGNLTEVRLIADCDSGFDFRRLWKRWSDEGKVFRVFEKPLRGRNDHMMKERAAYNN